MHDPLLDTLASDPDARAKWVHDLRNAVNVLATGSSLALRLLQKDRAQEAMGVLRDAEQALRRCQGLLGQAAYATQLPTADAVGMPADPPGPGQRLNS